MRRVLVGLGLFAAVASLIDWWRRHPRFGASYVNRVIDPWLVGHGIVAESGGELGLIEHVGRVSGTVRQTPVHPVATDDGFRIVVPLGDQSEWARNVLAAGRCKLQVGESVHELGDPSLVRPSSLPELPRSVARAMDWLGFRYLVLHRSGAEEGSLGAESSTATRVEDRDAA